MPISLGVNAVPFVNDSLIASDDVISSPEVVAANVTLTRGQLLGKITASGQVTPLNAAATDGSQNVYGILAENIATTAAASATGVAAASASVVYVAGVFKQTALIGYVPATHQAALRALNIYVKAAV